MSFCSCVLATWSKGVPDVQSPREKLHRPIKIYASGGGLLVTPINAPQLFT